MFVDCGENAVQPYRHDLRSVKVCLDVSALRNVWIAASRAIAQ